MPQNVISLSQYNYWVGNPAAARWPSIKTKVFLGFGVGCWLLVVGCWLLVVGCWLLVVGCWLLVIGYRLLVFNLF
jgi:hypothetical protein